MPRQTLKQRPDGRFQCEYKGKFFYGKTQSEAIKKRNEYKKDLEAGLRAEAAGVTVQEYAAQWVNIYKAHVANKTYNEYVRFLNRACGVFGSKKIRDVVSSDIKNLYNTRVECSQSENKHFCQTIHGMFEAAVIDRIIPFNPCNGVKPPKGKAEVPHRALEAWEDEIILRMAERGHRLALGVMVMRYAGLRRGEALACNIDRDFDFAEKTITVREAVRFESNQPVIVDPKSEAGKRKIPMIDILAKCLVQHHGLLMQSESGGLMSEAAFRSAWRSYLTTAETMINGCHKRWYGRMAEHQGAELPPWKEFTLKSHDLRHSFCTMLYEAGVDLKSAQKWMGHADEAMTLRIYTHLSDKQESIARKALLSATMAVKMPVNSKLNE